MSYEMAQGQLQSPNSPTSADVPFPFPFPFTLSLSTAVKVVYRVSKRTWPGHDCSYGVVLRYSGENRSLWI